MIELFVNEDARCLRDEVNEWISECGSEIHDIRFTACLRDNDRIEYQCCVITQLNLHIQ